MIVCLCAASCNKANGPNAGDKLILIDGHGAVDLGLSVKWASCNIGALNVDKAGSYFAWGEIEEKNNYDWSMAGDYKWGINEGSAAPKYGMTKYTADVEDGDGLKTLQPGDDPAAVSWGTKWRMPTIDEIEELHDETKCEWTWDIEKNGFSILTIMHGVTTTVVTVGLSVQLRSFNPIT